MEFKESIVKRRAIRKYDMTQLSNAEIDLVKDLFARVVPLISDCGKFDFKIVDHAEFFEKTGGLFRIDAPYYILLFGDGSDEAYKNIGYAGELVVLRLTELGFGTCWLGGATSNNYDDLGQYAVSIAFGKPLVEFREKAEDAKRKELSEIALGYDDEQKERLEMVRLAPSAVNFQPWYFKCEPDKIHVFRTKAGSLYTMMKKSFVNLQKIDIGIAMAHFTTKPFVYKKLDIKEKGMTYEGTLCF